MNKETKYAILYLHSTGKSEEQISKELKIDIADVKKATKQSSNNKKIKTTSSKVNSKDLMVTQTSNKKINSVAIMTKAASEVNDEFKKQIKSTVSRTGKVAIYKPNKNK
jgi:hypothetical protein